MSASGAQIPADCEIHFNAVLPAVLPDERPVYDLMLLKAEFNATATQTIDLINKKCTFTIQGDKTRKRSIVCQLSANLMDIEAFELYQGESLLASSESEVLSYTFSKDNAGSNFYIVVKAKDGRIARSDLLLTVNSVEEVDGVEFGGMEDISIPISEDVPFIGGNAMSFSDLTAPVYIAILEDGTVRLGVNVSKDILEENDSFNDFKTFKKDWEKVIGEAINDGKESLDTFKEYLDKKQYKVGAIGGGEWAPEVKYNIMGYGETKLDPNNGYLPEYISFNVLVQLSVKGEIGWQLAFAMIPVTIELEIEGGVSVGESINYSFRNKTFSGHLDLGAFLEITIFAGIGIKDLVAAGVEGGARLNISLRLLPANEFGVQLVTLSGSFGVKAYIGVFEMPVEIASDTWVIYDRNVEGSGITQQRELSPLNDICSADKYELIGDEYPSVLASSQNDTIISGAYPAAQPAAVSIGDDILMTFLASSSSRSSENKTVLMYTYYSGASGTWSAPKQADSNETADYLHKLYTDGENIYRVYTECDEVLEQGVTLNDFASHLTLNAAVYDKTSGKFTGFTRISESGKYVSSFDMSFDAGAPVIAWVQSGESDYFGQHKKNEIAKSSYSSGRSAPEVLRSGLNAVTSIAADGETVYYICDGDNKLITVNDCVLMSTAGSSAISGGTVARVSFTAVPQSGGKAPVWYENGGLYALISGTKTLLTDAVPGALQYSVNGDRIFFISRDRNNSPAVYAVKYENGAYSAAYKVLDSDINIQSFDICGDRII